MSAEPLTDEQLARMAGSAEALATAWGQRSPDLTQAMPTMADWGARIAREDVPALIASHQLLTDRLAQARVEATHNYVVVAPILTEQLEDAERLTARMRAEVNRLTAELAVAKGGAQ